jgi:hypothetical protein
MATSMLLSFTEGSRLPFLLSSYGSKGPNLIMMGQTYFRNTASKKSDFWPQERIVSAES